MKKTYLALSDEDKGYLKSLFKKRTLQAQVEARARILLYKVNGLAFKEIAEKLAISTRTIRLCIFKFNEGQGIKPFKIKYCCEKRDPDFESKMHDVLLVYKQTDIQFDKNIAFIVPDLCSTAYRGEMYRDAGHTQNHFG